jgi:hypothetical protein
MGVVEKSVVRPKHFGWHAVGTTEHAAISDREAQIAQRAAQLIAEIGHERR